MPSTHEKGDLAYAMTVSALVRQGCHVATPLHQHLHYDLIAERDGKCYRVQVKHGTPNGSKAIASLRTVYARKTGNVVRHRAPDDYDVLAVFHPEVNKVVFLKADVLGKSSVTVDFTKEPATFAVVVGE